MPAPLMSSSLSYKMKNPDMRCAAVVALGELGLSEEQVFNTTPIQVIEALISSDNR